MNTTTLTLLSIIILLLILLIWRRFKRDPSGNSQPDSLNKMELNVPQGPRSFPLLGHVIQLGDRPYETMFEWSAKYGPIYKVFLGSQTIVVLNGTRVIREALIDYSEGKDDVYF